MEIDRSSLLDCVKAQDLCNPDCVTLGYDREQLASAALEVVANGFSKLTLGEVEIRRNMTFCVRSSPHAVALRCLNRRIRQATGIRPADRDIIVRRLARILTEGVPHRVYKFDIRKFFDSIDTTRLFGEIANDKRVPRSAILVLENFLFELLDRNIHGLPRGIPLSSTLSEYCLKGFDQVVSKLPEVYYYARYVDDIVIVTGAREDRAQFSRQIKEQLPFLLRFNDAKTKLIDLPVQQRGDGSNIIGEFDYLGYGFSVHETSRVKRRLCRHVQVSIADKKIRRIKSRLSRAVAAFVGDSDIGLLESRLQLLTGNFNLRDIATGRVRNVGLYCNYRRANSDQALAGLDAFLRSLFVGDRSSLSRRLATKLSHSQRCSFLKFSFSKGFGNRIFYNFTPAELARLTLCWRDA